MYHTFVILIHWPGGLSLPWLPGLTLTKGETMISVDMTEREDAMQGAKTFIGAKLIKAVPMNEFDADVLLDRQLPPSNVAQSSVGRDGYLVEYEDGYQSWSPKIVFETAYREIKL